MRKAADYDRTFILDVKPETIWKFLQGGHANVIDAYRIAQRILPDTVYRLIHAVEKLVAEAFRLALIPRSRFRNISLRGAPEYNRLH